MRVSLALAVALAPASLFPQAAPSSATSGDAQGLNRILSALAGGKGSGRPLAIVKQLKDAQLDYKLEDFRFKGGSGTNIVVSLPTAGATRTLLLAAHYDYVPQGEGVVDNAASCAVLLSLLNRLQSLPLQHHTVTALFFDREESGLLGSQSYFARFPNGTPPAGAIHAAINLDIFGYGDTLFGAPSQPDGPLAKALRQAAEGSAVKVRYVAPTQYPRSDHQSMISAGVDTLGLALIDGSEIDQLRSGDRPPRILRIIHTAEDTLDKARPEEILRGRDVLEKMLRAFDDAP